MTTLLGDHPTVTGAVPSYGVVRAVEQRTGGCRLDVEDPGGGRTSLHVACAPSPRAASALRDAGLRPLALRLDVDGSDRLACSVLVTSEHGPQRRPVPLGTALALCADGVHTVLTHER